MIQKHMKMTKAFMCCNCSEQIRILGDVLTFKNSDIEGLLSVSQKCCNHPVWIHQYTRRNKK